MTFLDQVDCLVVDRDAAPARPASAFPPILAPAPAARRLPWGRLARLGVVVVVLGGLISAGWASARSGFWRRDDPSRLLPYTTVARVDLSSVLTASGRVESAHNTILSCELERLEMRSEGRSVTSGGASTILWLVDEGTRVKAGDVICRLDASDYEELVRTQQMKNDQAAAALKQAQLSFEVAEISVSEYSNGLLAQSLQSLDGAVIVAQSAQERAIDRLRWTEEMLKKGYVSLAQRSAARQMVDQCRLDLLTAHYDCKNFRAFTNPRTMMELNSEVEKRRFEVTANTQRVTRYEERLAYYRKMYDKCTIRAPHDGVVIYAIDPNRRGAPPIEPGLTVRQGQPLFFLPDLGNMQVFAYLHESVANRVHEGMTARARIEGLANRSLEGHVTSVAPLPTNNGNWFSDDVKYFVGTVQLDSSPNGLRPGMTAEVEVDVDRCLDVLAVPYEAVAVEEGRNICYIAGPDGLRRRPVELGRSDRNLLEVTRGLAEGDHVVLHPDKVESLSSLVVADEGETDPVDAPTSDAPTSGSPVSVE